MLRLAGRWRAFYEVRFLRTSVVALADGKLAMSMLVTLVLGIGMNVVKLSRKQNKKQFRVN